MSAAQRFYPMVLAFFSASTAAMAQEIQSSPGGWDDLMEHVGTYEVAQVLDDPRIVEITKEIDDSSLRELEDRLSVRKKIGYDGDCLVVRGSMERRGDTDAGQLFVCTRTKEIHFAILKDSEIQIYSDVGSYDHLPWSFRLWLSAIGELQPASEVFESTIIPIISE